MGAYEVQGFSLAITGGDNQTAGVGATFAQSLTMQLGSAIGEPVGPGRCYYLYAAAQRAWPECDRSLRRGRYEVASGGECR